MNYGIIYNFWVYLMCFIVLFIFMYLLMIEYAIILKINVLKLLVETHLWFWHFNGE